MAKRKGGAHGGHGWFVTFADLMGLLMAFFVVLVASSTQDEKKKHQITGSFREAFGMNPDSRFAGIVEIDGVAGRPHLKNKRPTTALDASDKVGPSDDGSSPDSAESAARERQFAMAAASLRQALQDMPEVAEASKNLILEEKPDGLDIQIVDQDGRAMFADGSREPYERTRRLISALVPALRQLPNRIQVSGHTSATRGPPKPGYGAWDLTADRANAVRSIMEQAGLPSGRIQAVTGRADTEPMFPDDPFLSANRRVSILLLKDNPTLPPSMKP
jgi:chemotaxis protein MotB